MENLSTNIPLDETITICINSLFNDNSSCFGFTRDLFRKFLELAVTNTFFIFNRTFYQQIEGVGMDLPLGPTLANIFCVISKLKWNDF